MADRVVARGRAKINLSLDIVGKREDGYHLLRGVMQSLSLCDDLVVERAAGRLTLTCDDPALPRDGRNAAYRAAAAFLAETGREGAALALTKRIPYQAGLGSASADAAAALRGLNALFGHPLDEGTLLALGLSVGSDVPFCLTGGTLLAEGIGERLSPLPPLPDCVVVLVKPDEGMATPEAFARYDALGRPIRPDGGALAAALAAGDLAGVGAACANAFEQVCPAADVAAVKAGLLEAGALGAAMTGSGTAVFGLFDDRARAGRAVGLLKRPGRSVFLTRPAPAGVEIKQTRLTTSE